MDLLERYVEAVRTFLTGKDQADILRELSENIRSEMDEKAAGLSRPLTGTEEEDIIRRYGHPVVAAARYGSRRFLISPSFFPFYWLTLKVALGGALAVRFLVAVITALVAANPAHALWPALLEVPSVIVPGFGWITVTFALLETGWSRFGGRLPAWNPRSLPAFQKQSRVIPRAESAVQVAVYTAALIWWQSLTVAPLFALGPLASVLKLGPVWSTLHWPILVTALLELALALLNLVRPHWTPSRTKMRLVLYTITFALFCIILRAGDWVVAIPGAANASRLNGLLTLLNQSLFYCWLTALFITGAQFIWTSVKEFNRARSSPEWRRQQAHG